MLITVAGGEVASSFLQRAVSEAETGTRKRFHAISYDDMIAWARELAKSKSKSKEPVDIATSEACGQAVALLDGDKPVTAELIARLIKTKIMAARTAELEARAAAAYVHLDAISDGVDHAFFRPPAPQISAACSPLLVGGRPIS